MPGPPARFDPGKHGQDLRVANDHERNDGNAMSQGHLDEIIAAEASKFIGIAIKRKRALNTFRQHAQDFMRSQDTVCVLPAGQHASEPGDDVRYWSELEQTGMTQETRDTASVAH